MSPVGNTPKLKLWQKNTKQLRWQVHRNICFQKKNSAIAVAYCAKICRQFKLSCNCCSLHCTKSFIVSEIPPQVKFIQQLPSKWMIRPRAYVPRWMRLVYYPATCQFLARKLNVKPEMGLKNAFHYFLLFHLNLDRQRHGNRRKKNSLPIKAMQARQNVRCVILEKF